MSDISTALTEAVKYLAPLVAGWLAKARRDINRFYRRMRRLEKAVRALQDAAYLGAGKEIPPHLRIDPEPNLEATECQSLLP